MRQSALFTKTLREDPKDEESLNAKLLIRAGFIYKVMAGVYSLLPMGFIVFKKIEEVVRRKMVEAGGQEMVMSSLHPRANWETTGRFNNFDVLFKFTSFYSKNDYVLGPTHEEIITPILKQNIFSYRDLPARVFQFQTKFRDEKRAKSGMLRGREFVMKDLYSFHADQEDLDRYYEVMKQAYLEIFDELGIDEKTYFTLASGGTFSKYSHEFQTITEAGEDTIHICDNCHMAINDEVIGEQSVCPQCGNSNLHAEKAIEVGNIFKLGSKFSDPFELKFKDSNGEEKPVIMGCYGIGITRLIGTIVEAYNDDKGMIWPERVAPYRFHLIETKFGLGEEIYKKLISDGYEVLYDDREVSVGEKFADADLIGIPYRLVISDRNEGKIELKKRSDKEIKLIDYVDIREL